MHTWLQDLRFGLRLLAKHPALTSIAVVSLAVGIGANAVVFSWIRAVLLDAVPGAREGDRLVVLCPRHASGRLNDTMSLLDLKDLAAETNVFTGITASQFDSLSVRIGREVEWIWGQTTMANFFDVLGVQPQLGRFFLPDEDTKPGGDPVVVISHALWQRRFAGDRGVVGREVSIVNRPFTIIGVAPANFHGNMGGLRLDLWIPITMSQEHTDIAAALHSRSWRFLHAYARLQPGLTLAQAQAAATAVMQRLEKESPATNRETGVAVLPVWKSPFGGQSVFLPLLRSLMFVTALLLLLVAANVANLLLARATARRQEMAVRLALGAGGRRLIRQLLVESVLLAACGGALGCLFASWGADLLYRLMPPTYLPIGYDLRLDGRTLLFSLAVTLVTGVLFGLAPALQAARTNLAESLKDGSRSAGATVRTHWLRGALVVAEVALALVLLVGMTLCARSLQEARRVDVGFDPRQLWGAGFRLPPTGYDDERVRQLYDRLRRQVATLPGVESVALADWFPLGFEGGANARFSPDGYQPAPAEPMSAGVSIVSADYFRTFRIPLFAGREFRDSDDVKAPPVAIINQHLAQRYFAGRDPLGRKIRFWGQEWTIVGVAKTGKYRALNEPTQPYLYVPQLQTADRSMNVLIRTRGDPRSVARSLERTATALDPLLKPVASLTYEDYMAAAFAVPRVAAILLSTLGLLALALAALGIYGVMSYSVSRRTRELGIRIAVGARPLDILGLVLKQGMTLTALGVLGGVLGAVAVAQVLSSLLVGVRASDPLTYAAGVVLMAAVALLACYVPARRAARVDPMVALRYE
jgi:predicted permease